MAPEADRLNIYVIHPSPLRALVKPLHQTIQGIAVTAGNDLDTPIRQILGIPGEAFRLCLFLRTGTKKDALNLSGDPDPDALLVHSHLLITA